MNKKNNCLFLIVMFLFAFLGAEETKAQGTLIISYQTGQKSERLDRIRLLLKNENGEVEMYPKGLNFVDDKGLMSRTVVIENLPAQQYTLHFLIPNKDGFFDEVPPREIVIHENDTLKIDQKIKARR